MESHSYYGSSNIIRLKVCLILKSDSMTRKLDLVYYKPTSVVADSPQSQ